MRRRPRRHSRRSELLAAFSALLTVGIIVGMVFWVRQQPSPLDPTPSPVTDIAQGPTATVGPTRVATPSSPLAAARSGSLRDLLRYSPDRLADRSLPLADVAQYADITRWMASRGVANPKNDVRATAEWRRELASLAIPSVLSTRGLDPLWADTYGFSLTDIQQVLAVGEAPDYVLIMRGSWNADALHRAWVRGGYQAVRSNSTTIWSLYPGDAVNLSAPASRPALGNMNNVVLLDDGTLIATARLSRIEQAVATYKKKSPSLGEHPRMRALLREAIAPDDLVTATVLKGSILAVNEATPIAGIETSGTMHGSMNTPTSLAQPMPQVRMLLAGMLVPSQRGAPATFSVVLQYDSLEAAMTSADVAQRALAGGVSPVTRSPYRSRLTLRSIRTIAANDEWANVQLTFALAHGNRDWRSIVEQRDLGFSMWVWNP